MADRPRDSGHVVEEGVVVGNVVDKARLQNPIARWMVAHFDRTLLSLVRSLAPASIHEVGCGEGRLTRLLASSFDIPIRATDVSRSIIAELRGSDERIRYERRSIYDLDPIDDSADVIVCCEVLEHLDRPGAALRALRSLSARAFVLSVPREPLWRILNVVRGKYWRDLGNTPGHLQHWSSSAFRELLETSGFRVDDRRQPLPWTMVLARRRPEVFEQRSDSRDLAPQ